MNFSMYWTSELWGCPPAGMFCWSIRGNISILLQTLRLQNFRMFSVQFF